ncbi:hypothetical protein ACVW1C_003992 [Bradyrhizobium sp. USDA 4011]
MIPSDDNTAICVLLSRFLREVELRDLDQKIITDANVRLKQRNDQVANLKAAFSVFGFDLSDENVWKKVAEQIGRPAYMAALEKGRSLIHGLNYATSDTTPNGHRFIATITLAYEPPAAPAAPAPLAQSENVPESATQTVAPGTHEETDAFGSTSVSTLAESDLAAASSTDTDEMFGSSAEDVALFGDKGSSRETEEEPPKVKETILERLRLAAPNGLKAAELRQYYENAFSAKLHEKTIGMTLYRLSKDELVRRDGRVWFYVPPEGETKNPGGGTPGLIDLLK